MTKCAKIIKQDLAHFNTAQWSIVMKKIINESGFQLTDKLGDLAHWLKTKYIEDICNFVIISSYFKAK